MHRLRSVIVAMAAFGLLACAPPASAYETVLQDDARVLSGSTESVQAALAQMKQLGVDRVRITVGWRQVSPGADRRQRPDGFDAADPAAYAPSMDDYFARPIALVDRAVVLADAVGLKVILDLGFGAPLWAAGGWSGIADLDAATRPDPESFAAFARAMSRRYSGSFNLTPDYRLPRVDMFELWNEPNVPFFLMPQFQAGQAAAADWYRSVVQRAYPAIKEAQPGATVLVGSTAAGGYVRGASATPVAPLVFIRRLACVDERLRPIRSGACRDFRQLPGDGFSHHPYALQSAPAVSSSNPGIVRIANLDRITTLLDRLVARRRLARGLANLWLTEFGYESNRPVPNKPWSLQQQAQFLAQAEYIAQRNSHVRSISQFLLRDINTAAAVRAYRRGSRERVNGSWQTGLYYEDGQPKPAALSFRLTLLPLLSPAVGRRLTFWGHVRPATAAATVRIEQLSPQGDWTPIATAPAGAGPSAAQFDTAADGTFARRALGGVRAPASFRLVWLKPDGSWEAGAPQQPQALATASRVGTLRGRRSSRAHTRA